VAVVVDFFLLIFKSQSFAVTTSSYIQRCYQMKELPREGYLKE